MELLLHEKTLFSQRLGGWRSRKASDGTTGSQRTCPNGV